MFSERPFLEPTLNKIRKGANMYVLDGQDLKAHIPSTANNKTHPFRDILVRMDHSYTFTTQTLVHATMRTHLTHTTGSHQTV